MLQLMMMLIINLSYLPGFYPRRSTRERRPSTRYPSNEYVTFTDGYVTLTDGGEPECYAEAMEGDDNKKWFDAMQDEMKSLHDNQTFELVKLPKRKKASQNRWVYRLKHEEILSVQGTRLD